MKILLFALACAGLLPAAAFAASEPISREQMKERWPLTVDSGVLSCAPEGKLHVVTFRAGGHTYGVNGTAKDYGKNMGWRDVREIWKDSAAVPGTKVALTPLIDKGTLLCK